MPKVSILLPVYGVEKYLPRCVESILGQSEQDWELVLVDDGSPDRCPVMCDEYSRNDPRIHVIHQKNKGLAAARNTGIEWVMDHSKSKWIAFMDSDDWVHKDYLKQLLIGTEQDGVLVSVCGHIRTSKIQNDLEINPVQPEILNSEDAYIEHYSECMPAWGKLIHRDLLKDLRFPEDKIHEDAFVSHIFILSGEKVAFINQNLYYYFSHPGSFSSLKWFPKRLDQLEAHMLRMKYAQAHNYQRAYNTEYIRYIQILYVHAQAVAAYSIRNPSYFSYLPALRKELRGYLKREDNPYPFNAQNCLMYLMAWHTLLLWYPVKAVTYTWKKLNLFKLYHKK